MINQVLPLLLCFILFSTSQAQETNEFTTSSNTLAFELLKETANGDNQVFSPLSITSAFAMTYAGAANDTATEMAKVLGLTPDIHNAFRPINDALSLNSEAFELNLVNKLWGQTGHPFLDSFLQQNATNYGARFQQVDFAKPDASRNLINDWIAEQTKERIQELLPEGSIDEYTKLVLSNAIYYKAAWFTAFQEQYTIPNPFTLQDGSVIETATMRHQGQFGYSKTDNYQLLELPYKGNQTTMQIILPNEGQFETVMDSIDAESLTQASNSVNRQLIQLYMPKFEFEQAMDLKEIFSSMGMSKAFTDYQPANECQTPNPANIEAADFSAMDGTRCLYIDGAYHKAFIAVDEKGTEAAAATAIVTVQTRASIQRAEPIIFKIDRPFLFTIKHNETGSLLFIGTVMNPQQ